MIIIISGLALRLCVALRGLGLESASESVCYGRYPSTPCRNIATNLAASASEMKQTSWLGGGVGATKKVSTACVTINKVSASCGRARAGWL